MTRTSCIDAFLRLKSSLVKKIGPIGGYYLSQQLSRNHPRMLMYHRFSKNQEANKVSADTFKSQMLILKHNFKVQPLPVVIDKLENDIKIEPNTIVITIDDGYEDFYNVAFPILKALDLPATLYVTTDFIDQNIWLWPDKISYLIQNSKVARLECEISREYTSLLIRNPGEKDVAWSKIIDCCIKLPDDERKNFIDQLINSSGITMDDTPPPEYASLTWDHIRELTHDGINIGAHTRSHPILSRVDEKYLNDEIVGAKTRIESMISKPVSCFCYPNGQYDDYSPQVKEIIRNNNFTNATVAFNDRLGWTDHYELRRYGVGENMFQFNKAVFGVEYLSSLLAQDSIRVPK